MSLKQCNAYLALPATGSSLPWQVQHPIADQVVWCLYFENVTAITFVTGNLDYFQK